MASWGWYQAPGADGASAGAAAAYEPPRWPAQPAGCVDGRGNVLAEQALAAAEEGAHIWGFPHSSSVKTACQLLQSWPTMTGQAL